MLSPALADLVVEIAMIYAAIGLGVGIAFLVFGIERIDQAAIGAHAFRPLLLPGLALFWPVVALRWWRAARSAAS
jgi:hypothetical protein